MAAEVEKLIAELALINTDITESQPWIFIKF
jgi:hypothetical protein